MQMASGSVFPADRTLRGAEPAAIREERVYQARGPNRLVKDRTQHADTATAIAGLTNNHGPRWSPHEGQSALAHQPKAIPMRSIRPAVALRYTP